MLPSIEQRLEWIADLLAYMRLHALRLAEARADAQEQWVAVLARSLAAPCATPAARGFSAALIKRPHHPRVRESRCIYAHSPTWQASRGSSTPYIGGFPRYVERRNQITASGYESFELSA
jgi:cyclohexanone monooxygenase